MLQQAFTECYKPALLLPLTTSVHGYAGSPGPCHHWSHLVGMAVAAIVSYLGQETGGSLSGPFFGHKESKSCMKAFSLCNQMVQEAERV